MLDAAIQEQLKAYLERLEQPIQLMTSLDDSGNSEQMRELINEIAELSDKVSVVKSNDSELKPSFRVAPLNNMDERGIARFAERFIQTFNGHFGIQRFAQHRRNGQGTCANNGSRHGIGVVSSIGGAAATTAEGQGCQHRTGKGYCFFHKKKVVWWCQ